MTTKHKTTSMLDGHAELQEVLFASGDKRLRNIKLHLEKSDATLNVLTAYTARIIKAARNGELSSAKSFERDLNQEDMHNFLTIVNS
ncbi:hypothetical protein FAI41_03095 [Acetobacteraceae bacterium]|nr:hypothetical protein FAI41_03095 [Acetobacteraceae bacterium]